MRWIEYFTSLILVGLFLGHFFSIRLNELRVACHFAFPPSRCYFRLSVGIVSHTSMRVAKISYTVVGRAFSLPDNV